MATGSATQSTNRVFLGGYTMRIEAIGEDFWCGWSNAIDLQRFVGALMLSCWISGEAFTGSSSLKAEVHCFNAAGVDLGSAIVWADQAGIEAFFKQFMAQVKREDLPVGTRFLKLRFGISDGVGTGAGIGYVDAVQAVPGDWLPAWTPSLLTEHTTLDEVPNGATYGRIKLGNLLSGDLNLASSSIKNRGALAILDAVTSKEIAKDAVTTPAILDGNITGLKIAASAVGSTHIAASAVGATQLANSVSSLTKVSGGILTGSGSTATLPTGKILNATAGKVRLRSFTSMPTQLQVDDGEWFAVTGGATKGIYVRNGAVAMNGAGTEVTLA